MKHTGALTDSTDLAFMARFIGAADGVGVVYATGEHAEFGPDRRRPAWGERHRETGFQAGLRRFSYLVLWVALTLATGAPHRRVDNEQLHAPSP